MGLTNRSSLFTRTTTRHDRRSTPDRRLRGKVLVLARVVWVVLAVFALAVLVTSLPNYVVRLQSICTTAPCAYGQLSLASVRTLHTLGFSPISYATMSGTLAVVSAVVWFGVGAVIFWRTWGTSDDWFAFLVALLLVLGSPSITMSALMGSPLGWQWSARLVIFFGKVLIALFLSLFPDGQFVPRFTRWLVVAWIPLVGLLSFLSDLPFSAHLESPLLTGLIVLVICLVVGLLSAQFYRYHCVSGPLERQQTKWVVFGVAVGFLVPIGLMVPVLFFPVLLAEVGSLYSSTLLVPALSIFPLLMPLSLGIAILRYHLWDLDVLINRTLVYATLTICVIALYVLVVGSLGVLLQAQGNLFVALCATGLVAVLFNPLRNRLQHMVNRLMYGDRDDPYRVLSHLSQRLRTTLAPEAVFPTIVETVAQALKLPYTAIALQTEDGLTIVASYGKRPQGEPVTVPLRSQKEIIGQLLLAPRAPGERFSPADQRLLEEIAQQTSTVAHAMQLTADLQRSRERLVTAREEERRRLRRDLHDGLGPAVATLLLTIDAVRNHLTSNPAEASRLLGELKEETQEALMDIRRVVYELRPLALDELGLVSALREQTAHYTLTELRVCLRTPDPLPPLPAAVEVAAYRIVLEALTNVSRHAHAHTCSITISLTDALTVEIEDDGCGLPEGYHAGVGIMSMRERAAELGGHCRIEANPVQAGTRVCACLPLPKE